MERRAFNGLVFSVAEVIYENYMTFRLNQTMQSSAGWLQWRVARIVSRDIRVREAC
jgi:hypothetical protein